MLDRSARALCLTTSLCCVVACKQNAEGDAPGGAAVAVVPEGPAQTLETHPFMRFETGPGLDVDPPLFDVHFTSDGRTMVARSGWLLVHTPTGEPRVFVLPSKDGPLYNENASVQGFLDDGSVLLRFDGVFSVLNTATGEIRKLVERRDGLGDFLLVGKELVALGAENQIFHVPVAGGDWTSGASLPGSSPVSPPLVHGDAMIWTAMNDSKSYVLVSRPPFAEIEIAVEHDSKDEVISYAAWAGESIVYAIVIGDRGEKGKLLRKTGDKTELLLDGVATDGTITCDNDSRAAYCSIQDKRWRIDATMHHELGYEPGTEHVTLTSSGHVVARRDGNILELRSERPQPAGATPPLITAATLAPPPPTEPTDALPTEPTSASEPNPASKSPGKPTVEIAQPDVQGGLPADLVRRIIRAHQNEILGCQRALVAPPPKLVVEIEFVITETGKVSSASASKSSGDSKLDDCVSKAVRRWMFPKPTQGEVTVGSKFTFTQ